MSISQIINHIALEVIIYSDDIFSFLFSI